LSIDLAEENAKLKAELERLRQEVERLKQLLEALTGKAKVTGKEPVTKASRRFSRMIGPRPLRKKRAAAFNHGRKRMMATALRPHQLERCPDCEGELAFGHVIRRRQVIDVPAQVALDVIEHQVINRKCEKCGKWHAPKLDVSHEAGGEQRFGHHLRAWVCYLRQVLSVSYEKIQKMLEALIGLKISRGELVEMQHQAASKGEAQERELASLICEQPAVHADETGWRENGENGYVWVATTTAGYTRYVRDESRATRVAEALLPNYAGTVVCDFYAVYNFIGANRQRCWAHLSRDLTALATDYAANHPEIVPWVEAVKSLYVDAQEFNQKQPHAEAYRRNQMLRSLTDSIHRLSETWLKARGHPAHAMCKRLRRHEDELFVFVKQPYVEATNNRAERSIRPCVVLRKISGGSRTPAGTTTTMRLSSLVATWQALGYSVLDSFVGLLRGTPPVLRV
jgi:transposase